MSDGRDVPAPALPRRVEADPRAPAVRRVLEAALAPLWSGGTMSAPHLPLSPALAAALRAARPHLRQGLEAAEATLAAERAGLRAGQDARLSRLLVCSADGAERFYRGVERLLRTHGPRLLALRLDADAAALGALMIAPGASAKCVLIERREAVADVLLALATPPSLP